MPVLNGIKAQDVLSTLPATQEAQALPEMVEVWQDQNHLPSRNPHHLVEREPHIVDVFEHIERDHSVERSVGKGDALLHIEHLGHIRPRTQVNAGVAQLCRKILSQNTVTAADIQDGPRIRRKAARHLFKLEAIDLHHRGRRPREGFAESWPSGTPQKVSWRAM